MPPLIQFSSDRKELTPDKHLIEDSIALRTITTLMALLGIVIAANLTESPAWLVIFSVLGCIAGSCFSYYMRYRNNLIGKIWISVGILVVAGLFFNELLLRIYANVADARTPLTQMLMALMALHSFDLPRRRDLSLSALVGFILITSASTLSRDFSFLVYFSVFFLLAAVMFQLDCASRSASRAFINMRQNKDAEANPPVEPVTQNSLKAKLFERQKPISLKDVNTSMVGRGKSSWTRRAGALTAMSLVMLVTTLSTFAILPRFQISFLKQIRIGSGSNLPFMGQIAAPVMNLSQLFSPDGSIKSHPIHTTALPKASTQTIVAS